MSIGSNAGGNGSPAHQDNVIARDEFEPCPLCTQYSHSIPDDKLGEALRHFESMYAHPLRGTPMGHNFDEQTRDFAQVLVEAARRFISRTEVTEAWQPIETAPKDGRRIHLGFAHMANFDVIGFWAEGDWADSGFPGGYQRFHGRPSPTHWRPLPQPPEAMSSVGNSSEPVVTDVTASGAR